MARVTLKMIAARAGTSIGTADRALNNRGGVSEESKRRVLQIAAELGYRPNKIASALGRKRVIRVGVVCPESPEEFYRFIYQGVEHAAGELQDYGVVVERLSYPNQNPEMAFARMAAIDPADFDGLAVNLAGTANVGQINRFLRSGVPVITFNTDSPDSGRLFYIGNHSHRSGLLGGEMLSILLGGQGNVTVLGNFARTTPFIERFGGFCEFMQLEAPGIRIYPCSECLSDSELAAQSLTDLLARVPDINGVFCTGYSSTVGAIEALSALGRNDVKVVGYDVTTRTAEALRAGRCHALLYQDPLRQGHQAVHLLVRHLLEGWVPANPRLYLDTQIVLRSNVESYLESQAERPQIHLEK